MRRTPGRMRLRILIWVALVVVASVGIVAWGRAQRFGQHYASAQAGLARLQAIWESEQSGTPGASQNPTRLAELEATLGGLVADLQSMEALAGPAMPILPHLGWLPAVGGDLEAAPHMLKAARLAAEASLLTFDALRPAFASPEAPRSGMAELLPRLSESVVESRAKLEAANELLAQAAEERASIAPDRLSKTTRSWLERFDRLAPLLCTGLEGLALLPDVLGAQVPRTYLIVAQNSDELRPTGGFISGVGEVAVDNGRISLLRFQDSYAVDDLTQPHAPAPAPLRRLMRADMLVLRDANWWPHYPTSAQAIADLYDQDMGQPVDGVVSVDLELLRLLVEVLSPLQVAGSDQPVTPDNLRPLLMSTWEAPRPADSGVTADWWAHRKDFAAQVLSAVFERLFRGTGPDEWAALLRAVGTGLRDRHVLLFSRSAPVQALIEKVGWGGALRTVPGDYLMVVDANVGFNKVNPNVEQRLDYEAVLGLHGEIAARLTLTYRHEVTRPSPACVHESRYGDGYVDLMERCYWDLLRVYLPPGSRLLRIDGADEPPQVYEENGKMVIETAFLLETGDERQVQLEYEFRTSQPNSAYSLVIQKQPGSQPLPVRVRVRPPQGARAIDSSPVPLAVVGGTVVWQQGLDGDLELRLTWR